MHVEKDRKRTSWTSAGICLGLVLCALLAGWRAPTARAENKSPAVPQSDIADMSIQEAILLALRHNRTIQSAYLDRVAQKFDLKVAEDEFIPNLDLTGSLYRTRTTTETGGRTTTVDDTASSGLTLSETLPTGGTLTFGWEEDLDRETIDSGINAKGRDRSGSIALVQPLLRGGGIAANTVSLKTARLNEEQNILSLKSTLIDTVSEVVAAFREFVQAQEQVEIYRTALARTRQLLERNRLLVAAGRMAAVEMVQVEADVANQEYIFQTTLNSVDSARLALLMLLDIDKHTRIRPVLEGEPREVRPDLEASTRLALANRPDYGRSRAALKIARLALKRSENNMLWDLSLEASYDAARAEDRLARQGSDADTWQTGLKLSVPIFGDLTRRQGLTQARVNLKKAEIDLKELQTNIEIEIQDLIREVAATWKQYKLAERALKLTEQKLAIETEKLNAGLSNNFQMVTFQNDLLDAQYQEIEAAIAYRNALTDLDRAVGTTLETWKIAFEQDRAPALE